MLSEIFSQVLNKSGYFRVAWQLNTTFFKKRKNLIKPKLAVALNIKLRGTKLEYDAQAAVMEHIVFLRNFLLLRSKLVGLSFFGIKGEKSIFRKRKNVNLNFFIRGNFGHKDFVGLLNLLSFWRALLDYMRRRFNLRACITKSLSTKGNKIRLVLVNPFLASIYAEGGLNIEPIVKKKLLIRVEIFMRDKAFLKEIYKAI